MSRGLNLGRSWSEFINIPRILIFDKPRNILIEFNYSTLVGINFNISIAVLGNGSKVARIPVVHRSRIKCHWPYRT